MNEIPNIVPITSKSKFGEVMQSDNFILSVLFLINLFFASQGQETIDSEAVRNLSFLDFIEYSFPLIILFIKKVVADGFSLDMLKSGNFWTTVIASLLILLESFGINFNMESTAEFINNITGESAAQGSAIIVVLTNIFYHLRKPKKYPTEQEVLTSL